MAFAPPRRTGKASQTNAATTKTRIPLLSPSKKVAPAEETTETTTKGPKVIASRYLQDVARRPAQATDRPVPTTRSLLGQSGGVTRSLRPVAPLARPRPSPVDIQRDNPQALQSPSRSTSVRENPNENQLRDILRLRLSHTLITCAEGEVALSELCKKAEASLGDRWHAAKLKAVQLQEAKKYDSLQVNAKELECLSTEDIFNFETFITRIDQVRADVSTFGREVEEWSQKSAHAPSQAWNERVRTLLNSCDAAHLVARSLLNRFHESQEQGIVSTALGSLSAILHLTREEVTLWQAFYDGVWQKKCQEIEAQYAALTIPTQASAYRPLWG